MLIREKYTRTHYELKVTFSEFMFGCGYPRWDEYSRSRHAIEPKWYDLQTASALVQMTGRAVRSNTDFASTFILDSNFTKFVERSESILPTWWLDAIQMET